MKVFSFIKFNWRLILLISVLYYTYVFLFIKPFSFKYFSLVDDGQVLMQSSHFFSECVTKFKCEKIFDQIFEFGTGRIRPTYWIISIFNYELFGNSALLHHIYRVFVIGYADVMLVTITLIGMNVWPPLIILSSLLYFTSFSFSENIIRLGTNEPYQVIFLGVFSLLYLYRDKFDEYRKSYLILLLFLLIWTLGIKESDVAILPTIFLTEYLYNKRKNIKLYTIKFLSIPTITYGVIILIKLFLPSTISLGIPNYVGNYITSVGAIFRNSILVLNLLLNTMSPFLKLGILILILSLLFKPMRDTLLTKKTYYWIFFSMFFVIVLFPWKYVLDRYQLVGIYGISISLGILFNSLVSIIRNKFVFLLNSHWLVKYTLHILMIIIGVNLFTRGFALNLPKTINYSNWFATFTRFEFDQVLAINNNLNSNLQINGVNNLNNWEFLYEVPIHLNYLYGNSYIVSLYDSSNKNKQVIFSRSSFDLVMDLDKISKTNSRIISSNSYNVNQIDPLIFRDKFIMKPIETISNPPLGNGYRYYWELREIYK